MSINVQLHFWKTDTHLLGIYTCRKIAISSEILSFASQKACNVYNCIIPLISHTIGEALIIRDGLYLESGSLVFQSLSLLIFHLLLL